MIGEYESREKVYKALFLEEVFSSEPDCDLISLLTV